MFQYKDKNALKSCYDRLGSTRRVGALLGVSNNTIIRYMRKYEIPRNPRLDLYNNNSGIGRRGELYIIGHPYFKKDIRDLGLWNDRAKSDVIWKTDLVNIKSCHYIRPTFRIKISRHNVRYYVCLFYIDSISPFIPVEIWIIPSNVAPHSCITPSLTRENSKYHQYKLSLLRGKEFSVKEENNYNKQVIKIYRRLVKNK